ESERAAEAGCAGDDSVIGAGGALAVRAHQRTARRWSESRVAGDDEGGERGLGAAGIVGTPGRGKRSVAEATSEGQLRAAAGRAVGVGCGHNGEAPVRSPGRCEGGVQPTKARASVACV